MRMFELIPVPVITDFLLSLIHISLQPTASALLLSRRAFVIACDVTCIDQYKVAFINQLLQYRVLLYHLLEDFFSFYQVVGSGH